MIFGFPATAEISRMAELVQLTTVTTFAHNEKNLKGLSWLCCNPGTITNGLATKLPSYFTQTDLIEPVLPQAAHLSILFSSAAHCKVRISLRDLI